MVKNKPEKPEESLSNLTNLEVPGFLNDFHQNSIHGISMLAGTFSGLAKVRSYIFYIYIIILE